MGWAKFDDAYYSHPKLIRAGLEARGLDAAGITYCAHHLTNGFIEDSILPMIAAGSNGKRVAAKLVEVGRWRRDDERGGYWVHDYLDYNPTDDEVREKREAVKNARSEAGKKGAESRWQNGKRDGKAMASGDGKPVAARDGKPMAPSRPVPIDPQTTTPPTPPEPSTALALVDNDVAQAPPIDDATAVFNAWVQATNRTGRTQLDAKRRKLIKQALANYPLEDVTDAVRGWQHSPHHRGENPQRTVYNDLGLLLRDAAHIEKFRDLERGDGPQRRSAPKSWDAIQRVMARRAEQEASNQ